MFCLGCFPIQYGIHKQAQIRWVSGCMNSSPLYPPPPLPPPPPPPPHPHHPHTTHQHQHHNPISYPAAAAATDRNQFPLTQSHRQEAVGVTAVVLFFSSRHVHAEETWTPACTHAVPPASTAGLARSHRAALRPLTFFCKDQTRSV